MRCSPRSGPRPRSTRTSRPSCRRHARSGRPPSRPDPRAADNPRGSPPMASTRDIRRRIKSVKNSRQITKAMELVAASKMKKAQQVALAGLPYANLMADVLAALSNKIDEAVHPFLAAREVKMRGILLITTDKGLCGPLNANLFKLVVETQPPAKFYSIGRKGTQFLGRTRRTMVADFQVHDRVPYAEVKVVADFMTTQYLEGVIDTIEV